MPRSIYTIQRLIEDAIAASVDPETGEISDEKLEAELDALDLELEAQALDIAAYILELRLDADAVEEQTKKYKKRIEETRAKADSLERRIAKALNGKKVQDYRVRIGWRKSTAVSVVDESQIPHEWFESVTVQKFQKAEAKNTLSAGKKIPGLVLVNRNNIQIKP